MANEPVRRGGRQPTQAALEEERKRHEDELEANERRRLAFRRSDLRRLAALPEFRRFVQRLLDDAQAFTRSYDTSKTRLIHEGRAMLAMEVWHEIETINPEACAKILLSRLPRTTAESE